jgi:magnesium chelatase family protein
MVAHVHTVAFTGMQALPVQVQVALANGLPTFTVVGLPDKTVNEARERIRAAFTAIGLALPPKRITVNLAPADLQKEGSHFDLPIALGILAAMDIIPREELLHHIAMGEIGLDGRLQAVNGILPAAVHAAATDFGLICPASQGAEATWSGNHTILAPDSLLALLHHFKGDARLPPPQQGTMAATVQYPCLSDVKGQETAKRALEIAAAGGHNILFSGPPGSGKSMLASRLPGLLPPMDADDALETNMLLSIAGLTDGQTLHMQRPFRDPHHSASIPALIGGGHKAKPGEISLAHNGVLFLDEFPEFPRAVLETLRQPLETGTVAIARANAHVTYPARVQLVAAMNPCRCGYVADPRQACRRAPHCATDYQAKISGPIWDRIDLFVDVPAVDPLKLGNRTRGEPSHVIAARVARCRDIQKQRYAAYPATAAGKAITCNAHAAGEALDSHCQLCPTGHTMLTTAADKLKLTARSFHRILRVARTLADMDEATDIAPNHLAEALNYRQLRLA